MSKQCAITGKSSQVGGRYSNRTRATVFTPCGKFRRKANLQSKKFFVPELGKTINLTVSTRGLRTINKLGVYEALKKAGNLKKYA